MMSSQITFLTGSHRSHRDSTPTSSEYEYEAYSHESSSEQSRFSDLTTVCGRLLILIQLSNLSHSQALEILSHILLPLPRKFTTALLLY